MFRMAVLYAVAAWLIMQVAEVLIDLAKLPDWIGTTTLGLLAVGFPIALIFSWFYELTPEGISLETDVDAAESITHVTDRRLDFIVISLLCAAVILFAYDKWWIAPPPEFSIAVLPFENMSADPEQEYFSDGISEEILNVLAQIPGLQVTSRSSAFSFKGMGVDIPTVAKQLGVANVLEGSVRKSGKRIRITAQLIDARTDTHLWSETYDRDLENIFAVQDEISAAIVEALTGHLGLQGDVLPRVIAAANIEAYEAYLRGRHLVVQRTRASIEGAVGEFEKAIALDPDYALAHAELAIVTGLLSGYGDLTDTEAIVRATPHAKRAMTLDPTLAEANAATGYLLWRRWDLEEALTHFEKATQINPNYAIVHNWMAIILEDLGRYDEAFLMQQAALKLDPLSVPTRANYLVSLIKRNRLEDAARELEKLATVSPSGYAGRSGLLSSVGGKWANLVLGTLDALRIDPENAIWRSFLSYQFAAIGLEKEALAVSLAPLPSLLSWLGRSGDAIETTEARLAEDPISLLARRDLGLALASAGDYARARPILEEMWQRSGGRIGRDGLFPTASAAALIIIRRDAGEDAQVGELMVAIRDNVRRSREAGIVAGILFYWDSVDYEEGLIAYLAGERESGLALIAKAVEEGTYIPSREAYLRTLYDDPGFAPILATQEARQAHERDRFLTIVCTDNPYATVWQPAEGTCEEFAAAGGN